MKTYQRSYLCNLCMISNKVHTSSRLKSSKVGKTLVCNSPGFKNQICSANVFDGTSWPSALGNSHARRVTTNTLFDFVVNKYCLIPQHDHSLHSKILENMIPPPESLKDPIHVPQMRLLMGPGPSNVSTRVLQAQALPTLGHLHPEFCKVMDEVKAGIQYAFQTKNALTLALSATGHAGMEAVMANLLEAGDTILIAENGIWGQRAEDMAKRKGAIVQKIVNPPGTPFSLKQIEEGLKASKPVLFFITHGESSTGVVQTLEGIGDLCANNGVLFAVDTVASLGGVPVETDKLGIDVIYTGSQKVLSCPPGTAPISFSEKAVAKIKSRKSPPHSFYLDMNWLGKYWNCYPGEGRVYHHTGPVNSMYALREALAILSEEGLIACYKRHQACTERLHDGLKAMGLELFVENPEARLPTVTTIKVPEGIDWKEATVFCMKNHNIEIAGGLGPTAGKVWRIGVMGTNATKENVERVLKALQDAIKNQKK